MDRRQFVEASAYAAAAVLPAELWRPVRPSPRGIIRVRGVVKSRSRGIAGVAVSDGLQVIDSSRDGSFELVTTSERDFVMVSIPSGFRIPQHPTGTASFYRPIVSSSSEMTVEFDLEPLPDATDRHTMLLLADVQTEDSQEMEWFHQQSVPDIQGTMRTAGDDVFAIACGDIMFDNLELYPDYERAVAKMGLPAFQVVGNHDLDLEQHTDEASTQTFSRHFGPTYYSFDRGLVHYAVLDDVFWRSGGYLGYLDLDQLTWLANDLSRVEAGQTVIVSLHIPTLGSRHTREGAASPSLGISVANREALYEILAPYNVHVLCGHTHENEHVFTRGVHEHVSGTVCGAWWSGPICADGTPNGYSVYEASGAQVTWRYKATGHPDDHQMRIYPRGADPAAPSEIVANIWDWDPEWTVVWYVDGERKGPMARRVARDPLSEELHRGPDLPERRKWVEPYPTAHLFYAPVPEDARRVHVEATDRFGRQYVSELSMGS